MYIIQLHGLIVANTRYRVRAGLLGNFVKKCNCAHRVETKSRKTRLLTPEEWGPIAMVYVIHGSF